MSTRPSEFEYNLKRKNRIDLVSIDALLKLIDKKDKLQSRKRNNCNHVELMVVENSISYYRTMMVGDK